MDRLRCLQVFAEVARSQSFVRAAWRLSISKATVTKHVAWLENSMGSQLLNRNSKQVTLTDAGLRVLESAQELLERYERLETDVRDSVHLPRGSIRVGTPPAFGIHHRQIARADRAGQHPVDHRKHRFASSSVVPRQSRDMKPRGARAWQYS